MKLLDFSNVSTFATGQQQEEPEKGVGKPSRPQEISTKQKGNGGAEEECHRV